jgi:CHASE3 domain sensor protein
MKRWLSNRASQSLGVTLVLLAIVALVSFLTTRRLLHEASRVEETYNVRERLAAVLSDLKDAETGQRGYLLTGESRYLAPYERARRHLGNNLADLRERMRGSASQQARLDDLEPIVRARMAALEPAIALQRADRTDEALRLVRTGEGKRLMDQVRTLVAAADAEEQRRLDERAARAARAAWAALLVQALGGALGVVLLAFSAGVVNRDIAARVRAEAALEAAYEKQKRIAETLQRSLLIEPPSNTFGGLSIATFYEPAWDEAQVGGDFYDAFSLSDGRVALVVGDASGKGLTAAARTAETKYALRAYLREHGSAAGALGRLNDFLCHAQTLDKGVLEPGTFVALSLALVDAATGETEYALAGVEPPVLLRSAGGAVAPAAHPGLPLGVEPGHVYESTFVVLAPGDVFFLATDGITEARRSRREFLGYEGMVALAESVPPRASLAQVGQAVLEGARAFANGKLTDDACLLLVRRSSSTENSSAQNNDKPIRPINDEGEQR